MLLHKFAVYLYFEVVTPSLVRSQSIHLMLYLGEGWSPFWWYGTAIECSRVNVGFTRWNGMRVELGDMGNALRQSGEDGVLLEGRDFLWCSLSCWRRESLSRVQQRC